jgi:hypothetical protein
MKRPRRQFLHLAAGAVALPAVSRIASAETYPTRPITMIVPGAAGGPNDVFGRIMAEGMRRSLGQPVIVENVTGADGSIGTGRAARARPDGYTIDVGLMSSHVLNGAFYSLSYDVLNDFAPIAALEKTALIIVGRKTLPAKDLPELIAWLKGNPNKASVGVVTVGVRLLATYFQKQTGTQFALAPYRGTAPAMQDLVAGQIDLLFDSPRTSGTRRQHQSLCGDGRRASNGRNGYPDLRRGGTAGAVLLRVGRALRVEGHATGNNRQAQCRRHGGTGRSGGARTDRRVWGRNFSPRPTDTGSTRRAGEGRCSEMVADHQGVQDQSGMSSRRETFFRSQRNE